MWWYSAICTTRCKCSWCKSRQRGQGLWHWLTKTWCMSARFICDVWRISQDSQVTNMMTRWLPVWFVGNEPTSPRVLEEVESGEWDITNDIAVLKFSESEVKDICCCVVHSKTSPSLTCNSLNLNTTTISLALSHSPLSTSSNSTHGKKIGRADYQRAWRASCYGHPTTVTFLVRWEWRVDFDSRGPWDMRHGVSWHGQGTTLYQTIYP